MTNHRKILWKFKPYDSTPWYVIGIGNSHFLTVGQGYVKDTMMIDGAEVLITMKNVLSQALVPKFGINLFSIRAFRAFRTYSPTDRQRAQSSHHGKSC